MAADAVIITINSGGRGAWLRAVTYAVTDRLEPAGKLPGLSADMPGGADIDTAEQVGAVVREVIESDSRTRTRGHAETLSAAIFDTLLDRVDWREVGRYYYGHAREEYAEDHGLEAYPS
jgi:hypothetical protein